MADYSKSGKYGSVLLAPQFPALPMFERSDRMENCGWHSCNDLYSISYPDGLDNYLLFFTVGGQGEAHVGGKRQFTKAGELMIIPPGNPCEYFVPHGGNWEFYWIHIKGENAAAVLAYITAQYGSLLQMDVSNAVEYIRLIVNMRYVYMESEIHIIQLISKILFEILEQVKTSSHGFQEDSLVLRIISHIEKNYQKPFSLKQLSHDNYMSQEHVIRMFSSKTGITPYRYYRKFRIMKAAQALKYTDISVKQLALQIGYSSLTSFSIQFKKEMGISPSGYRSQNKVYQN